MRTQRPKTHGTIEKTSLLGRWWQTFNIGYGAIGSIISVVGWTSIMGYIVTRYFPSWTAYLIIPVSVGIVAMVIGMIMIKKRIYLHQNEIPTENNPYLGRILGFKEYLGYAAALKGIEVLEETTRLDIKWFSSMGYNTKKLERKLEAYLKVKEYYRDLMRNANPQAEIPENLNVGPEPEAE